MYEFHQDKVRYFNWQTAVTKDAVVPFVSPFLVHGKPLRVLEIGCGEAGVLKAFIEQGHYGCGVELSPERAQTAQQYLAEYIQRGQAEIISKNIYDIDPQSQWTELFDLIVLKDVIEHIPDQARFIPALKSFLRPEGVVFFAYPPWWMPFGGHQQVCRNKWLSKLPWYHLLPMSMYKLVLRLGGESAQTIQNLVEVKETGITIERLKGIVKSSNYTILKEKYWLINPIYAYKFSLKQRTVYDVFSSLPLIRNFYTTAHYIAFKK
jgi:2-polyprenyl-3-methyl-5-hydroxy-6-metoxy-1,4-benzoquinol methylase